MCPQSEKDKAEAFKKYLEDKRQRDIQLYCCPFCGNSVINDDLSTDGSEKGVNGHTTDCFFTLTEKLRLSNGQNVALAQRVADAWKKRFIPAGHKLVSEEFIEDESNSLQKLFIENCQNTEHKTEVFATELKDQVYPHLYKASKSVW